MRLYFEIKNKDNDKCVPLPLLDKIVAKFFDGQCDKEKYFVPEGERVNWVDVCEGLLWANDLKVHRHAVDMRELSRQLTENGCFYVVKDKSVFLDLFRYFENINLYLFVVFLDQSMFAPRDENAWYMTTEPDRKYAEKEIDDCLGNVISREVFVRNLKIVEFFKKELDEEETPRNPQESDLWERIEADSEDTMEQIQKKLRLVNTYVDNYPNGWKIVEARSLIEHLELKLHELEKERREEEDWRELDKNDYSAMCSFKYRYPDAVHKSELEYLMWRYTENNMSPEQLMRYCEDWRNDGGVHINEAFDAFNEWWRGRDGGSIFELKRYVDKYPNFPPASHQYDKLRAEVLFKLRANYIRDIGYLRGLVYEGIISKEEIWRYYVKNYVRNRGKTGGELGNNKTTFLEQVRMNERNQVFAGIMSQEVFIQKLIELLSYYADLELEDYRGWIEEDTYNKLIDAVFEKFLKD